jgi:hypothetical protein
MSRSIWILYFAIFMHAMPSWGQSGGVIRDGKEWLQPVDFTGYTYNQVNAVCPGGLCSGTLPGSSFDLTGYTWASVYEVSGLFNSYGVDPPFTEPFQFRHEEDGNANAAISLDFAKTFEGCFGDCPVTIVVVRGMLRDQAPVWISSYVASASLESEEHGPTGFSNTYGAEHPFNEGSEGVGAWFFRQVEAPPQIPEEDFIVRLEEPIELDVYSGIGNLRGWAIAEDRIDRVEIHIDGKYKYDAPYGGSRGDVGSKYPGIAGSNQSGFSLSFGYSNLGVGEHTVTARAYTESGESKESTSIFSVTAFQKNFINKWAIVDVSQAGIYAGDGGNEFELVDVWIDGQQYILSLRWRPAEQGFEIVKIMPVDDG